MKPTFEDWVLDYEKLRQAQADLAEFIDDRYEHYLRIVARQHWKVDIVPSRPDSTPCMLCKVLVTSIFNSVDGWYCEWDCDAQCRMAGTGWYTPLDLVENYLALLGVT